VERREATVGSHQFRPSINAARPPAPATPREFKQPLPDSFRAQERAVPRNSNSSSASPASMYPGRAYPARVNPDTGYPATPHSMQGGQAVPRGYSPSSAPSPRVYPTAPPAPPARIEREAAPPPPARAERPSGSNGSAPAAVPR